MMGADTSGRSLSYATVPAPSLMDLMVSRCSLNTHNTICEDLCSFSLRFTCLICWKGRPTERGRERRISTDCHNGWICGSGPLCSQEPGTPSRSPTWYRGLSTWAVVFCFPRHTSREPGEKWKAKKPFCGTGVAGSGFTHCSSALVPPPCNF